MKILVGISGGVDSAYAALKLKNEGHDVAGAVLVMHDYTELDAAREVAESVGISLYEIDCRERFEQIKENFVSEYVKARTPNPCIICNERVKFRTLYDFAMQNGFDKIATGHYASITLDSTTGRYAFTTPKDTAKDQTYMLYRLPQEIMSCLVLPLSALTKSQIRENAQKSGLSVANRADSQEICFLPEGNHTEYIEMKAGKCPDGNFIDDDGKILGRHKGIIHYTVGQRKGLGISLGERAFVTNINPVKNTVTLSPSNVGTTKLYLTDMVYSGIPEPTERGEIEVMAKIRYTARPAKARAELLPDKTAILTFDSPQKCAPGQSAVLYGNDLVLCGGFISLSDD